MKRFKTKYPGVFYREAERIGGPGPEKIYYAVFKKNGEVVEAKCGRQYVDDMTPAKAARIRAEYIEGKRLTPKEQREKEKTEKAADQGRWTIGRLYTAYMESRREGKGKKTDHYRYEKYIKAQLENMEPSEITVIDIQRLKKGITKAKLSSQSEKHILNLLTWIVNYGIKNGLCDGIPFKIKKPTVDNEVTEFLTNEQLKNLLIAIENSDNIQIANMLKLVLNTGLRRGECLKLKWSHIDFHQGFINIKNPKGGRDQRIPMNDQARLILEGHPMTIGTDYVFPGVDGKQRVTIQAATRKIRNEAGLPLKFRMLHGLRHHYATTLAASGQVDLYTLQKLLTHKDSRMTQRYAHILDENLKKAANVAGQAFDRANESNRLNKGKILPIDEIKK